MAELPDFGAILEKASSVTTFIALCAVAIVGAVIAAAFGQQPIAGAILVFGLLAGIVNAAAKVVVSRAALTAADVPSEYGEGALVPIVPSEPAAVRSAPPPQGIPPFEWVVYRNLKSDRPDEPTRWFVDLREACLVPSQLQVLVEEMCTLVRRSVPTELRDGVVTPRFYEGVAVPKAGNPLFGVAVAHALNLAPVMAREWPIYGRSVETVVTSGRLMLVDDIWSQGRTLVRALDAVRDAGFTVAEAFILVKRKEGSLDDDLRAANIQDVYYSYEYGDEELAALATRIRSM